MGLQSSRVPCWIFPGSGAWALAVNIKKNIPIALLSAQPAPDPVTSHRPGELGFWQALLSPYLCLLQWHLQWVLRGGESQELTGAACPRHSSLACFNGQHRCFHSTQFEKPRAGKKMLFCWSSSQLLYWAILTAPKPFCSHQGLLAALPKATSKGQCVAVGPGNQQILPEHPKGWPGTLSIPTPFTALATYVVKGLQPHFWSKLITAIKSSVVFLCFCCPALELWMCHGDRSPALLAAQPCSLPAHSSHSILSEQWHRFPTALLW